MNERVLIFFEGPGLAQFWPLCVSRPPYLLRCGATMLYEKWVRRLRPARVSFSCRPELHAVVAKRTGCPVNQPVREGEVDIWVLDGRWLPLLPASLDFDQVPEECCLQCVGRTVGLRFRGTNTVLLEQVNKAIASGGDRWVEAYLPQAEVSGTVVEYLWDIVDENSKQIEMDFALLGDGGPAKWPVDAVDQAAVVLRPERVRIGLQTEVGPQVVLDARGGPIILGRDVVINPHSYIEGPAVVGDGSRIYGGKIRAGTTIGPVCRIGGEVENSVFLGYANKYHDGFIGHCVVGEWVNLGALTTNSDVKNNYHPVRVEFPHETVDTGRIKVGAFLADHTKTGIGTLLPTGGTVGFGSNIFGGGTVGPRMVPEFTWMGGGTCAEYRPAEAKHTASAMCNRRNVDFSDDDARVFDIVFEKSKPYRDAFLAARGRV